MQSKKLVRKVTISQRFPDLQKAKTPTPSTKPSPKLRRIPDRGEAPKKTIFFEPPSSIPLHTLQPGEDYDGDTLIPQEYRDEQARLDRLDDQKVKCDYQNHIRERKLRAR